MSKKILLIRVPEIEYNLQSQGLNKIRVGGLTIPQSIELLIRVPEIEYNLQSQGLNKIRVGGLTIPLGVTYLAAVVRQSNIEWDVQILDLYGEYYEEFVKTYRDHPFDLLNFAKKHIDDAVEAFNPDIVGFSASFLFQHSLTKELISSLKHNFPQVRIYLGGYATIIPEIVMKSIPELDVLFIGESEKSIVQVLEAEEGQGSFFGIDGIAFRQRKKIVFNKELNLTQNLDSLPFPAFDLLPLKKYKQRFGRNEFPIMTSRSCPFACAFCSSHLYSQRKLRLRKTENLISEIKLLHQKYGLDYIYIRDDNFIVNKEHAKNFLKGLLKENIVIPWVNTSGFHVNSIDEELLDLCKATKCQQVVFAVESGSPRVLENIMGKRVNLNHAKNMADYCHQIGLSVQCYFVIGNPGETKEEIRTTIKFADEMQVDQCTFSLATPFPGTRYYEIAKQKNYLVHDPDDVLNMQYMNANLSTEEFDDAWLKNTQYDASIKVNFLGNRLLSGDRSALERALTKYNRIFERYNFHVIARIIQGYVHGKLGEKGRQDDIFKHAVDMLGKTNIRKTYIKYINWDSLPTNDFRQWAKSRNFSLNYNDV